MIYFGIGYAFEKERQSHEKWNMRKTILGYAILMFLEIINHKYGILDKFWIIMVGAFSTFLLADIFDRILPNIGKRNLWKLVIRNLFYIYLFHDPLNYIVLRIFMNKDLLTSATGCIMFMVCRTIVIFAVALALGELVSLLKKKSSILLKDKI